MRCGKVVMPLGGGADATNSDCEWLEGMKSLISFAVSSGTGFGKRDERCTAENEGFLYMELVKREWFLVGLVKCEVVFG